MNNCGVFLLANKIECFSFSRRQNKNSKSISQAFDGEEDTNCNWENTYDYYVCVCTFI